jgi:Chromo (CHRromatin Organisation MOdifier) domain
LLSEVRRETHELGANPKLIDQSDGPYQVVENDDHTLLLRVDRDLIRVSSDRITPAPFPLPEIEAHLSLGNRPDVLPSEDEVSLQPVDPEIEASHDPEGEEYVVERLVGLRREADGSESYKVRWFGYSRDEDTWQPPANLPPSKVKRYRRRVGLSQTI